MSDGGGGDREGAGGGGRSMLREGDSGSAVEQLQLMLIRHGYNLKPDNFFGPLTRAALEEFQVARGLAKRGLVDEETWKALER